MRRCGGSGGVLDGEALRAMLIGAGASVVGFASMRGAGLPGDIAHFTRAVAIGVAGNLREENIRLLGELQRAASSYLRRSGYRYLGVPPDSDRAVGRFISRLYPMVTHKLVATSAGLGWVGRNGLLISPRHGPRLSLASVLTDAPIEPDEPTVESGCGKCRLCAEHCPSGAIAGLEWSRRDPFPGLVDFDACRAHKERMRLTGGKPNCGLCIAICPHGRAGPETL